MKSRELIRSYVKIGINNSFELAMKKSYSEYLTLLSLLASEKPLKSYSKVFSNDSVLKLIALAAKNTDESASEIMMYIQCNLAYLYDGEIDKAFKYESGLLARSRHLRVIKGGAA